MKEIKHSENLTEKPWHILDCPSQPVGISAMITVDGEGERCFARSWTALRANFILKSYAKSVGGEISDVRVMRRIREV